MQTKPSRVSFTVLAAALFFVVALKPSPSNPSVSDLSQQSSNLASNPAHPASSEGMEELASWAAGTSSLHVLRPADLTAALRATSPAARQEFALFRSADAERRLLEKLPFGGVIAAAAERNRVDGLLLAAVVETESRFATRAVSPRGARGLMQVLPSTAEAYGERDLFDPHVNLEVGSRYLGSLLEQYNGDIELAVAAYNAGPATVARYGGVPPYRETRTFVRRVIARYTAHHLRLDAASRPELAANRRQQTLMAATSSAVSTPRAAATFSPAAPAVLSSFRLMPLAARRGR